MYVVMHDEKSSYISHGPWYKNARNCCFSNMMCFPAFIWVWNLLWLKVTKSWCNYARSISCRFYCLTIVKVPINWFLARKLCRHVPRNSSSNYYFSCNCSNWWGFFKYLNREIERKLIETNFQAVCCFKMKMPCDVVDRKFLEARREGGTLFFQRQM